MAENYVNVPVRDGLEGVKDKAAIMDAIAVRVGSTDRQFVNAVREITEPAGHAADRKVQVWFDYVKSLNYTREFGEIFAHPREVMVRGGGDCDDLTILLLAGLRALAIPCCCDIVVKHNAKTNDEDGVHVRVRVGLPPTMPPLDIAEWQILDPVEVSEREWSMLPANTPPPTLGAAVAMGTMGPSRAVGTGLGAMAMPWANAAPDRKWMLLAGGLTAVGIALLFWPGRKGARA